jgi:hypothetical protein
MASLEDRTFAPRLLYPFGIALLLAHVVIFLSYIWRQTWPLTASGEPRFIDFIQFWIAARFAITETAARAYDQAVFAAAQAPFVAVTKGRYPYYHLVYPPTALPLIVLLGPLPYLTALATWILSTATLYLFAIYRIVPYFLACLLALLPIAVAKNIWFGQTGFLVAGLLGLSLGLMARKPFLAGLLLGVLTFKPQYVLIFPVVLLVTRQWRMMAGACAMFAILCVVVTAFYGVGIWEVYSLTFEASNLDSFMPDTNLVALHQTVFGLMQWLDAGFATKWIVHVIVAIAMTTLVCCIFRRPVSANLKAAALGLGALTVTPYLLAYDLTCLTVPVAFLAREGLATGFLPGERMSFLGCFLILLAMQYMPVGPFIVAVLMALVLRRVLRQGVTGT